MKASKIAFTALFFAACLDARGQGSASDARGYYHSSGAPASAGYPVNSFCVNDTNNDLYQTDGTTWYLQPTASQSSSINAHSHTAATVTDGSKIDFTASGTDGQDFTATIIAGSLDSTDLGNLKTSPRRMNVSGGLPNQVLSINTAGTAWTPSYGRVFARSVSSNTTLSWTTDKTVIVTASNVTITLPTAVGWAGQSFIVKQGQAVNTVINTTSSQTIDGSTQITLSNTYDSVTLISDGANWLII